jgi:amphiphysin
MTSSQARIAETLETFYGAADRSSEGAMAGHAYKRSVDDLDSSFVRELVCLVFFIPSTCFSLPLVPQDGPFRTTISEPLGKMCAYFPVVNEHITKRNKKVE